MNKYMNVRQERNTFNASMAFIDNAYLYYSPIDEIYTKYISTAFSIYCIYFY